jgi:UDP-hydrolysing UDP-N-acetyl-D-glucosamine 2-epimerase
VRTIAVLTTGRQDWGIVHSTAAAIRAHPDLQLGLVVGGMHLSPRHGLTVDDVRSDGFEPDAELDWLGQAIDHDPPAADQAGAALAAVGAWLRSARPDALLLAGDRLETMAAAVAATLEGVPLVHLHGGEQTAGAFDDALRHAITKLSHLHLVSHDEHAQRVVRLGEDPATVHVVGAPGLDAAARPDLPTRAALAEDLGIDLSPPVVLVTVHPETASPEPVAAARAVVAAMDATPATYVISLPNSDPGADEVRELLVEAGRAPGRVAVEALGERRYWGLLHLADAMLGNSSGALIEAPVVGLPAVDVGDRQGGRRHGPNVIHALAEGDAVRVALADALRPAARAVAEAGRPPLADGRAGARIADILAAWRPPEPLRKPPIAVPD